MSHSTLLTAGSGAGVERGTVSVVGGDLGQLMPSAEASVSRQQPGMDSALCKKIRSRILAENQQILLQICPSTAANCNLPASNSTGNPQEMVLENSSPGKKGKTTHQREKPCAASKKCTSAKRGGPEHPAPSTQAPSKNLGKYKKK